MIQHGHPDLDRLFRHHDTTQGDLRVGKDWCFSPGIHHTRAFFPLSDGAKLVLFIQEQQGVSAHSDRTR